MATILERLTAARMVSTPIVAINTPDQPALATAIAMHLGKTPVVAWDIVRGVVPKNKPGQMVAGAFSAQNGPDPLTVLAEALTKLDAQSSAVLIYENAQRYVGDAAVMQAIMNLRDEFKRDGRMLILIGQAITLPPELQTDVVVLSEELPDDSRLNEIVVEQVASAIADSEDKASDDKLSDRDRKEYKAAAAALRKLGPDGTRRAAVALRGTSSFGAEQLTAMAITRVGIDLDTLHTQAKALIEQTPGLTFERGKETFDDIGGLEFIKGFAKRIFAGPRAPAVVIRVEELEKAMAGAKGDLSGTSGDALQVLLSEMEDNGWSGLLAYGTPGAGKSITAKAMANSYGAKAIRFDINACKGSLVGASEKNIRQAMQIIRTIGGDRVFFVASCNRMDNLPPELQRRFRCGVWFFDIPDDAEREQIWKLNLKKFGLDADVTPDEADLTGADIRNICEQAYTLNCSLGEARQYVVPLKKQSPGDLDAARNQARGRFTDASRGGVYDRTGGTNHQPSRRKVAVG